MPIILFLAANVFCASVSAQDTEPQHAEDWGETKTTQSTYRLFLKRADSCPEEMTLRDGIVQRIGRDPFSESATETLIVEMSAKQGRLLLVSKEHRVLAARDFGEIGSCKDMAEAISIAVSILLTSDDALTVAEEESANETERPAYEYPQWVRDLEEENPEVLQEPEVKVSNVVESKIALVLSASPLIGIERLHRVSAGVSVGLGLRWEHLSLRAGFRLDHAIVTESVDEETLSGIYRAGFAEFCLQDTFFGCAQVDVGVNQMAHLEKELSDVAVFGGIRGGVEVLFSSFGIRPYVAISIPFQRATVFVDEVEVYRQWPVAFEIGLEVIALMELAE